MAAETAAAQFGRKALAPRKALGATKVGPAASAAGKTASTSVKLA
jgi:hypothetical protein